MKPTALVQDLPPGSATTLLVDYTHTYDNLNRPDVITDSRGTVNLNYDYSPAGRLNKMTDSHNNVTNYLYDAVGRLNGLWAPNYGTVSFRMDPGGRRVEKWLPNGVTTRYAYNPDNSLKQVINRASSATIISQHDYLYDGFGNRRQGIDKIGTVTRTATACTGTTTTTLTLDRLNRTTNIVQGTLTESYAYDHSGRRIRKLSGTVTSNYLYQGEDIYAEYGTAYTAPVAVYTHGPATDDPLIRLTGTIGPNATPQYYHQDGLGSVVAMSNATGGTDATTRYDAWGNKVTSTGTTPQYGYTGREPDATGLVYYRARYYDPGQRRFTQRDPIGLQGGINQYVYVNNNPINYNDPNGLRAREITSSMDAVASYFGSSNYGSSGTGMSSGNQSLAVIGISPTTSNSAAKSSPWLVAGTIALAEPTPVGEIALGVAIVGAGVYSLADKMATEIQGITARNNLRPQGEVYSLRATQTGNYPNVRGGTTLLNAGDVYKFGETTQPDSRYSFKGLEAAGLEYKPEFRGSQMMSKIVEKQRIYGHFFETGSLPPGNSIFR